jgi:hypothetical protein
MAAAFALSQLAALPDALLALWLTLLGKGVLEHRLVLAQGAALGLGASTAATWFLRTVSTRVQRRFRDKVTIALESHVAQLQASVATVAHQERPEYLDRLSMLRNQVFVLDHMYMSLFSTLGWVLRLGVTMALLASIHPALILLVVFAVPTVLTSTWRPEVERSAQERGAQSNRLARHLFTIATTAHQGRKCGSPASESASLPSAVPRGAAGTDRWRLLGGARRCGTPWRGRYSASRISVQWCSCHPASARRPARCCWCSPQVRGCRRTSAPPSARLDSCADSGWKAPGGSRGLRTTPLRLLRQAICRFPPLCTAASGSTMCLSRTPARHGLCWTMYR